MSLYNEPKYFNLYKADLTSKGRDVVSQDPEKQEILLASHLTDKFTFLCKAENWSDLEYLKYD